MFGYNVDWKWEEQYAILNKKTVNIFLGKMKRNTGKKKLKRWSRR